MNPRPTIILLILALLGVAAMMWSARQNTQRAAAQVTRQSLLSADRLLQDKVTRITLERANQPAMSFVRTDAGWNQDRPFAYPMDGFSMQQLIEQALRVEIIERLDPAKLPAGITLATLRLDPPAVRLTYEWPDGTLTLRLGKISLAGRAYLRIEGDDAILMVSPSLHERALHADPKEWRERVIFQNVGIESDRIERDDGGTRMVLARDRKIWYMLEPVRTRLDPAARDVLMQELGRARIGGFLLDQPDDLKRFGLDKPVASLTIITGANTQRLLIGAAMSLTSQDRFGMIDGRPVVVKIPAMTLASLFRKPENVAAATACGTQAADVKSIVIRHANTELKLERDLERWLAPAPAAAPGIENKEIPPAYVEELLTQLTTLKAPDVQFAEYPRELEIATITLLGFDGKALDTVRIAQEKDSGRLALENGDNVLRVFPAEFKMRLTAGEYGLK